MNPKTERVPKAEEIGGKRRIPARMPTRNPTPMTVRTRARSRRGGQMLDHRLGQGADHVDGGPPEEEKGEVESVGSGLHDAKGEES